jgi:isopenicillin N synthase-like dioxygenase
MPQAIPVIDLTGFMAGEPGALAEAGRQVRHALTEVGFFVLTGHGVPEPLIAQTFAEAKRVHELPRDTKLALRLNDHNNGYMASGRYAVWTSDVNRNDKPDLNEAFFIKRERAPNSPLRLSGRRFTGPNVWPAERDLPDFRDHILDYFGVMDRFTDRFLRVVAVSLGLNPEFFLPHFVDNQANLRLSHYPPVIAEPNQFGIAPHTDANFMTFLAQSEVPGLQIRTKSDEWAEVPFIPGSFAVNAGDTLKRWSN